MSNSRGLSQILVSKSDCSLITSCIVLEQYWPKLIPYACSQFSEKSLSRFNQWSILTLYLWLNLFYSTILAWSVGPAPAVLVSNWGSAGPCFTLSLSDFTTYLPYSRLVWSLKIADSWIFSNVYPFFLAVSWGWNLNSEWHYWLDLLPDDCVDFFWPFCWPSFSDNFCPFLFPAIFFYFSFIFSIFTIFCALA